MSVECFLDTNVIVYAATGRGVENVKRERALELIENREFGLSRFYRSSTSPSFIRSRFLSLQPRRSSGSSNSKRFHVFRLTQVS